MTQDILFLLAPGFEDKGRREFCPECAEVWGVLHYFPAIKEALDIRYQPLGHPRPGLVEMLGDGDWNCPTLILAENADAGVIRIRGTKRAVAATTDCNGRFEKTADSSIRWSAGRRAFPIPGPWILTSASAPKNLVRSRKCSSRKFRDFWRPAPTTTSCIILSSAISMIWIPTRMIRINN